MKVLVHESWSDDSSEVDLPGVKEAPLILLDKNNDPGVYVRVGNTTAYIPAPGVYVLNQSGTAAK